MTGTTAAAEGRPLVGASLEPVDFAALAGWAQDDHAAALEAFARGCNALVAGAPALRPTATAPDAALLAACRAALALPATGAREARAFFETWFQPHRVRPDAGGEGFLTGYYEPEVPGSLASTADFPHPLLARPGDLVTIQAGEPRPPGLDPALAAGRRTASGGLEPYPDRAAIEAGALRGLELVHVRDEVDAFLIQVQGSARLRLPDGRALRVAYAGRNGHSYTSIGRLLAETGRVPLEAMSLERLKAWLRHHPEEGRAVMRANRSFVFFRIADELAPEDGPIGGAGISLTPGRSLAVDRTLWSYGLPFFLQGALPGPAGEEPLARLMIAQDTGSAIVGPARGDYFHGTGEEAGRRAGLTRHAARFTVLLPRPGR